MAITEMTRRQSAQMGYCYSEEIPDGQAGNDIKVPPMGEKGKMTCTLIAGAGTGKFQFSTSPDPNIEAGTATWMDWPKGDATGTVFDTVEGPITGLRGVSVAGSIKIEIVR